MFEKIENFKKDNPSLDSEQVDDLVKSIAIKCIQKIVENEEFDGRASGAWYGICDDFDIKINKMSDLLPMNRMISKKIQKDFEKACKDENIDGIKIGLKNFAKIHHDSDSSVVTDAIIMGKFKTLKFFIEDDFINNHNLYKNQINFNDYKSTLFNVAFYAKQKEILEYLIFQHDVELTQQAKEILKREKSEFKNEIVQIIKNKHLNFILDISLQDQKEPSVKKKI